jgi:hypothetical protein
LREQLGWVNRGAHATPRVHDLRHNSASRIIPTDLPGREPEKYPLTR